MGKRDKTWWALTLAVVTVVTICALCQNLSAASSSATGTIAFAWKTLELRLSSQRGMQRITVTNGKCVLPAGTYDIDGVTLMSTDQQGVQWRMQSDSWHEPVEVRADSVTRLDIGPPFTARVSVSRHRVRPGATVKFGLKVTDRKGRSYRPPRPRRGGRSVPRLALLDAKGSVIGKYNFEYG